MKIRITAFIMCLLLILTLCACGNADGSQQSDIYNPDTTASENVNGEQSDEPTDSNTVKFTVPEGYTLLKTAWALEEKGVCTTEDFLNAAQNYDLSKYTVLSSLKDAQNVCFKLEGYLFPATYNFQKNEDPVKVIDEMVSAFQSRFSKDMLARASELGYSVHEILTIASIIEKEAYTDEQRTLIASTIYNRLNKGMQLQYDVTTKYCTGVIEVQYPDRIDDYKYYYNGYRAKGLIAGPICNPGLESINAALYPAQTDYLYFVIDTEPPYESAFAVTYEEHQQNCQRMGY